MHSYFAKTSSLVALKERVRYEIFRALLVGSVVLSFSGCASLNLPPISGDSVDYKRTDPAGGTQIHAEGVTLNKDGTVNAALLTWNTTYPFFTVSVTAKNVKEAQTTATVSK